MDLLIRVIDGPDEGLVQSLQPGPNVIGRGKAAAIKLSVEDVSWEHALVTRDQDQCFLENLSALGTWVGEAKVNGRVRVRPGDKIRLTQETVLRIESASGAGTSRAVLITALVVMLVVLGVVGYYQVLAPRTPPQNWDTAYAALLPWLQTQVKNHRMQPETTGLFREAWRHSQASDWSGGERAWIRLQIVLSSPENKVRCLEAAAHDQDLYLNQFLAPPPGFEPTDDQYASALGRFADRWLAFSIKEQSNGLNPIKPN